MGTEERKEGEVRGMSPLQSTNPREVGTLVKSVRGLEGMCMQTLTRLRVTSWDRLRMW